jgi:hypothetical protein
VFLVRIVPLRVFRGREHMRLLLTSIRMESSSRALLRRSGQVSQIEENKRAPQRLRARPTRSHNIARGLWDGAEGGVLGELFKSASRECRAKGKAREVRR